MLNNEIKIQAEKFINSKIIAIQPLKSSGSSRQYYRCRASNQKTILIAENEDIAENNAFFRWADFLGRHKILVPEVNRTDKNKYITCEDLGDFDLFQFLTENKEDEALCETSLKIVLTQLVNLQKIDVSEIDFFYPVSKITKEIIFWDLYYFKYNFLKLVGQTFNEYLLEKDFKLIADYAQSNSIWGLQYRDFQSRNIMLVGDTSYFIDFQSIRQGDILYDAVSLLYQSRLKLSERLINRLKNSYKNKISEYFKFTDEQFENDWLAQALLRNLQTLGAYGLRGIIENKSIFIQPLAQSLVNLDSILDKFPIDLPELRKISKVLKTNPKLHEYMNNNTLEINIQSFSYKKGLPKDNTEHGGGFIFDCRNIHNPGQYDEFKSKTGKDSEVIDFFEKNTEMEEFLFGVYYLVDKAIEKYLNRNFEYLAVNFGCTGGQHRSVFSAESLQKHLYKKYGNKLTINLTHRELQR